MGKSQETYSKKENEKKRRKKKEDKRRRMEERKENPKSSSLDDMMAYIDENGNIVDTPPDPSKKKKVVASNIEIAVPKREVVEMDPIRNGRVEFMNDEKGYGFILDLETQEKYFVHVTGLLEEVHENDKVSFELERGLKGMNAVRVKKTS